MRSLIRNATRRPLYRPLQLLLFLLPAFLVCLTAMAQKKSVSGTVTGPAGQPLAQANITIKGTTTGTTSDENGQFSISAKKGDVLVISFVNYANAEITIGDGSIFDVRLQQGESQLEEVVVIGYGTQRRREVTGATVRVAGSDLEKNKNLSVGQSLQGQAAGVQVTSNSGQPGDALRIVVRGVATNGNSNPLYVIDGMPAEDISYLNPADIESMDILKDAASAAIYGARSANGVVLITTRKGKAGRKAVSLDMYYGWQNPTKKMSLLNAKEYAIIMNEAAINSGKPAYFVYSQAQIDSFGKGTDWQEEVRLKNAVTQSYNLGLNGGNDQSVYATSIGYQRQEGLMGLKGKSFYERVNLRVNSDHKLYKDIVKIGENLAYIHSNQAGIGTGNIYGNSIRGLLNTSPTFPAYNADGSYARSPFAEEINPVAAMDYLNNNKRNFDRIFGNTYMEVTILKGLKIRTDFGMDLSYENYTGYTPKYDLSSTNKSSVTSVTSAIYKNIRWNWDNTISYTTQLGNHNIALLAGTTAKEDVYTYVSGSRTDLVIPGFEYAVISNGTQLPGIDNAAAGSRVERALQSYFGRVNYTYDGKYMLSAIIRRDGSSVFGPNNRYGYFPSFSAGWVVTNENFGKPAWLNFLKIRGGWGRNGNDRIGDFRYMATISSQYRSYYFGGFGVNPTIGASPSQVPNPNLKWEAAEQTNIGFDATLFKGLSINFDWYNKTTRDWLVTAPIPDLVGNDPPIINGGHIVNKGVEIALNYQKKTGAVTWSIGGNIAFNSNTVKEVPNREGIIHGASGVLASNTDEFFRIENGFPIGYFWGYQANGIFQNVAEVNSYMGTKGLIQPNAKPGDVRFVDRNGNGTIDAGDKTMIGNPNPDYTYGFNISANWNGFDFTLLASGVGGNDILDGTRAFDRWYNNYSSEFIGRWTGEGTSSYLPRVTLSDEANNNWGRVSTLHIHNGSFMRVKTISIGYDLKKHVLAALPFQQCRIYATVLNPFTFTSYKGLDPEVGYGNTDNEGNTWSSGIDLGYYPQPRTVMVGLSIKL
ncbi:SusC/RagA family TonB-linked outer membrane protein [Filimonas effusa]|uniref:TonB-dependent receptor n=1 Tax=Filimonas effusa TaxID=2508721 RepID=A0A4Q1D786_9BACT|nr:TonB-dependent receptor [Filimonas effusa]RXK83803.1 TonB-dependent receptor [Filimonas effusa]